MSLTLFNYKLTTRQPTSPVQNVLQLSLWCSYHVCMYVHSNLPHSRTLSVSTSFYVYIGLNMQKHMWICVHGECLGMRPHQMFNIHTHESGVWSHHFECNTEILCEHFIINMLTIHLFLVLQDGFTPLYVASDNGHTSIVDVLLRHGADPNLALTVCVETVSLVLQVNEKFFELKGDI